MTHDLFAPSFHAAADPFALAVARTGREALSADRDELLNRIADAALAGVGAALDSTTYNARFDRCVHDVARLLSRVYRLNQRRHEIFYFRDKPPPRFSGTPGTPLVLPDRFAADPDAALRDAATAVAQLVNVGLCLLSIHQTVGILDQAGGYGHVFRCFCPIYWATARATELTDIVRRPLPTFAGLPIPQWLRPLVWRVTAAVVGESTATVEKDPDTGTTKERHDAVGRTGRYDALVLGDDVVLVERPWRAAWGLAVRALGI